MDINVAIMACVEILDIRKPVEIRLRNKNTNKVTGELAGWAETRNRKGIVYKHVINININRSIESDYALLEVIAHELVHSLMLEHGKLNVEKHHDENFQNICKILERGMQELGMPINALYDPVSDDS